MYENAEFEALLDQDSCQTQQELARTLGVTQEAISHRLKSGGMNIHGKKLLLCIWWDQLDVMYYELLKPNETITGTVYRRLLMRMSRKLKEKRTHYYSRYDKVIFLHDNARPHVAAWVKTYLETLKWIDDAWPV